MGLKNLSQQEKSLIVAGILILVLLGGIVFLGYNFIQIDKDGVKCMDSPLGYAEKRMLEDKNEVYDCSCTSVDRDGYLSISYP